MALKRKVFFGVVKALLVVALLLKPHSVAKGAKVYTNTTIKNPTKIERTEEEEQERQKYRVVTCNISAYTPNEGGIMTASGRRAVEGRTIAMDDVPFGTKVEIEGHIYIVEDRFGGGYTNRIDIFMNSVDDALRWGRKHLEVKIYE